MSPDLYIFSLHAVAVVALFTMAGYFFGCMFHDRKYVDKHYVGSRHWMSMAMFIMAILVFVQIFYHIRINDSFAGASVSLIFFFATSQMASMALVMLIRPDFHNKLNISLGAIKTFAMAALLGGTYHFASRQAFVWATIIGVIFFVVDTAVKLFNYNRLYKKLKEELANYYSENYESYLHWMPTCTVLMSIVGFVAPPILLAPIPVLVFFFLLLAFVLFYVFLCYERYIVYERYCTAALAATVAAEKEDEEADAESAHAASADESSEISTVEVADNAEDAAEDEPEDTAAASERLIRDSLAAWIAEKKYCQPEVNIIDLSRQIGTNRTYLSRYINTTYHVSFRVWIASLRIEEAKRLLMKEADMEEISDKLGFNNSQTFIRTFTQQESVSPAAYRKMYAE